MATDKVATQRKSPFRTGHCSNGNCEGTRPLSPSGKPMPTCTLWRKCKCDCHKRITKMYEISGMPRPEAEKNPDYKPDLGGFVMPDVVIPGIDTVPLESGNAITGGEYQGSVAGPGEGPLGDATSTTTGGNRPRFHATPTGRKAKGSLEFQILEVCQDYANNIFDWPACTPKLVAEEIGKRLSEEPPSTGAINAAWDRWEKLEFAVQDKKPSRFVKFNTDSSYENLMRIKARLKQTKRRTRSENMRGLNAFNARKK